MTQPLDQVDKYGVLAVNGQLTTRDLLSLRGRQLIASEHGVAYWGTNQYGTITNYPMIVNTVDGKPLIISSVNFKTFVQNSYFSSGSDGFFVLGGVDQNNKLWTWGSVTTALLRSGANATVPTQVGTDDWIKFVSGQTALNSAFGIGLKMDGTLWFGGNSSLGQSGNNTTSTNVTAMTQIGTDTNWADVYTSATNVYATKTDGTLWAWGRNTGYVNGNGTATGNQLVPVQVGASTDWIGVKFASTSSSISFIKADGTLWSLGSNAAGQTGQGTGSGQTTTPTQIGIATNWVSISGGTNGMYAVNAAGELWGYGQSVNFPTWGGGSTPTKLLDGSFVAASSIAACGIFINTSGEVIVYGSNAITGVSESGRVIGRMPPSTVMGSFSRNGMYFKY